MQCISCEVQIDPKWKHAINNNLCPFCGDPIMDELLKNLLAVLLDTMEKLESYPNEVNDWLLSNYSYIKTDSPNLFDYVPEELKEPKVIVKEVVKEVFINSKGQVENAGVSKQEPVKTENKFFDRTDIKENVQEKTSKLKELKAKIERAGGNSPSLPADIDTSEASQEDIDAWHEIHSGNGRPASKGKTSVSALSEALEASSGVSPLLQATAHSSDDDDGDFDAIPSVVAHQMGGGGNQGHNSQTYNPKDIAALQNLLHKSGTSAKRMSSGNGKFSRSG